MERLPTYNDLKYKTSSKIFESEEIKDLSQKEINEAEKVYDIILEKIKNNEEIEEGFLGGILGGAAGALVGPSIGKAICKALGIDEKGTFGKLLTSRLVTTAIGIALGK
jgi:outer membrane lipoprotein SlyB